VNSHSYQNNIITALKQPVMCLCMNILTRTVNTESGLNMHSAHAIHVGGQFSCSKLHKMIASVVLSTPVIKLVRQC